eukprot:Gb_11759 [translate_table: standard]
MAFSSQGPSCHICVFGG